VHLDVLSLLAPLGDAIEERLSQVVCAVTRQSKYERLLTVRQAERLPHHAVAETLLLLEALADSKCLDDCRIHDEHVEGKANRPEDLSDHLRDELWPIFSAISADSMISDVLSNWRLTYSAAVSSILISTSDPPSGGSPAGASDSLELEESAVSDGPAVIALS
jgi:hypothetical protein